MEQKWEAKVSKDVVKAKADQVWPLFEDFFSIHKWFPGSPTCYGIQGTNAQPGCIRYCTGLTLKHQPDESNCGWVKERLTLIDPTNMILTYEIVDSNIGFNSYVATIRAIPRDEGCTVEGRISVDPVAGWERDEWAANYDVVLQFLLEKLEAAIVGS